MFERQRILLLGSGVFAMTVLIACGHPGNPPPPEWMSSPNPSSSTGAATAAAKASTQSATREAPASSLDALRGGQSTETPASSPLKDVRFGFDRYNLSDEARATLKANAEWLKANPSAKAQIEGHCDERGTADYNLALGAKRAQAAKDYLVTLGISADRLSTVSYGEEIPVCKESTESCWERNRRDRFVIMPARPAS